MALVRRRLPVNRRLVVTLLAMACAPSIIASDWGSPCSANFAWSEQQQLLTVIARCTYVFSNGTQNNAVTVSGELQVSPADPGIEDSCIGDGYCGMSWSTTSPPASTTYNATADFVASQFVIDFDTKQLTASHTTPPPQRPRTDPPPEDIQECWPNCSPLVLDMDGDGVATTGADDPVNFDIDADGVIDTLGWLARNDDDALLWRDLEKNHRVDDGSELFGVGTTLPDGRRATDGFVALAAYDRVENGGNADGFITNRDAVWRRLRLWIDVNHNGLSEREELSPIQSSRVIALSLACIATSETDAAGNEIRLRSTYRYRLAGGRSEDRALVDVFFRRIKPLS